MKVPYPSINGDLALISHMYICTGLTGNSKYEFVKCQTLKPYMIMSGIIKHYCDEKPDITRNPFTRATRIDCDKTFNSCQVEYDEKLLTSSRTDVCTDLFEEIKKELVNEGYEEILLNEAELVSLNKLIKFGIIK